MKRPRLTAFDRRCFSDETSAVIGVDEAGRGAFAGPVVAGAFLATREFYDTAACTRVRPLIRDSKQLTLEQREIALRQLERCQERGGVFFAPGVASVEEIADENILGATRIAMKRALDAVLEAADCSERSWQEVTPGDLFFCEEQAREIRKRPVILVDGRPLKPFYYPHTALVKGDGRSFAIAAASIVAKVTRDRLMRDYHQDYPSYGFDSNKGYGTPRHLTAIQENGTCPLHREKFLRNLIAAGAAADEDALFDIEV